MAGGFLFADSAASIGDASALQWDDCQLLAQGREELQDGRDLRARRAAFQARDDGLADAAHLFELLLGDAALIPRLDEFADQGDAQIALGDFFGRQERVDIGDCILLLSFILAHR